MPQDEVGAVEARVSGRGPRGEPVWHVRRTLVRKVAPRVALLRPRKKKKKKQKGAAKRRQNNHKMIEHYKK